MHFVRRYGELSQTFVADAVLELDAAGWTGWVATRSRVNEDVVAHPPAARVIVGRRPSSPRLLAARARRQSAAERRAAWLLPQVRAAAPDLLHAHFGWMAVDAAPIARQLGVPLLTSFHGTDLTVFPRLPGNEQVYESLFADVDRVTVVSRFLEAELRSIGYAGRIDIVPAGVRLSEIPFRGARAQSAAPRLLFVGRQVPRKGLDVLLRALPAVLGAHPDARLAVIGEGESRPANEALAARLGLGRRVEFRGGLAHPEVLAAMREHDVLVMPSRTPPDGEAEGSPVTTKEAQAVGLQVVATDNGGTIETLPPARHAEIVPEGDAGALAARIVAVLGARDAWEQRAGEARAYVEAHFDWPHLAQRLAGIYAEMVRTSMLAGR